MSTIFTKLFTNAAGNFLLYEISRELDKLSSSVHSARPTVEEAKSPFLTCDRVDNGRSLKLEYNSIVINNTTSAWEIIFVMNMFRIVGAAGSTFGLNC